jgi:hypothetical protein
MYKRVAISFFLLLTYSLGFANNFIPHNHNNDKGSHVISHKKNGHQHHHHNSTTKHSHTHQNTSENNNTGDFYNLLLWLMHDAHQHDDSEEQCYLSNKTSRILDNKIQANNLFAVRFSVFAETERSKLITNYIMKSEGVHLEPPIDSTPHRGPPSIS